MQPRITINTNRTGELEIWLNEAGRDLLVSQLQSLSQQWDHIHLSPDYGVGIEVQTTPYREGDQIIEWTKVLFRTDEGDTRYFPHVMAATETPTD